MLQRHLRRPRADGADHLGLFAAHGVGAERCRRFHGNHGQQLDQVVGHHVAQGAGGVVEATPRLDTDGFRGGDLHMVDVVVVPERLEQPIGEPADQNVLHRFFAQVVVNTVDLPLAHHLQQAGVQRLGTGQVGAERLLHHDPPKAAGRLVEQAGLPKALGHFREETRRGGQVKDGVAVAGLVDALAQGLVGGRVEEIARLVVQALGQPRPEFFVQALGGAFAALVTLGHERMQACGKFLGRGRVVVNANDAQVAVEQTVAAEVVQRRHEQALDQVAIGAEQKQRAGGCGRSAFFSHSSFFSTWPPKPRRMAESTLSP